MKGRPRGFVGGIVVLTIMVCGFENAPRLRETSEAARARTNR